MPGPVAVETKPPNEAATPGGGQEIVFLAQPIKLLAQQLSGVVHVLEKVVVVEDALSGNDVVLERAMSTIGVDQVDPMSYGCVAPPVLSLDVSVPLSVLGVQSVQVPLAYACHFATSWFGSG